MYILPWIFYGLYTDIQAKLTWGELNKEEGGCVVDDETPWNVWSASSLSCIALLVRFNGDRDDRLPFVIDECTPIGCDSGGMEGAEVDGVGVSRDPETVGDVGDANLDDSILFSWDTDVTSREVGLSKFPSLDLFACIAAAAAAAAAATFAVWDELADDKHVDTPLVIVTLDDPVGEGTDL